MTHEEAFQACISSILEHEGGLTQDKRDLGGVTQWGISLRYLRSIGYDINGDGKIDKEDIIGLPLKFAEGIYRKYWWDKLGYSGFNDLVVVEKVFDLAVNCGSSQSHKFLQRAINEIGQDKLVVDGILGGLTFGAANRSDGSKIRQLMREEAESFYLSLIKKNPDFSVFKNGWVRRARW